MRHYKKSLLLLLILSFTSCDENHTIKKEVEITVEKASLTKFRLAVDQLRATAKAFDQKGYPSKGWILAADAFELAVSGAAPNTIADKFKEAAAAVSIGSPVERSLTAVADAFRVGTADAFSVAADKLRLEDVSNSLSEDAFRAIIDALDAKFDELK